MFGHLKPEDFINLMEGGEPSARQRTHLEACGCCREIWNASKPMYAGVNSLDAEMPEPDWEQFRSSVRDQLLSRTIQRQTAVRRWTGWAVRPAIAWALSLFIAVGIPTGALLWHLQKHDKPSAGVQNTQPLPAPELIEAGTDKTIFDDLIELNDSEQAQFQAMLEAAQRGTQRVQ